jgi:UDP-2,3-diacylglucosamine hydrolase
VSGLPKLGIIAGGGTAPRTLIDVCQKLGRDFFVVCLEGQADKDLAKDLPHVWLPLGAAGKLKTLTEDQRIKEIVMIGRVRRPSLSEIKPDWLALKILTKIGIQMVGDDALLQAIGKAMEEEGGVRVVGAQDIFAGLLTPEGQLGQVIPDDTAHADIARGVAVARSLGQLDIGQSVIVQEGLVLAVEAIEGTDALIARSASLCRGGMGAVLVKMAKPQQDNRYDLPTVGPDTIAAMTKATLRGIAIEAGRSLLIDREKTQALADDAGIFILGIKA